MRRVEMENVAGTPQDRAIETVIGISKKFTSYQGMSYSAHEPPRLEPDWVSLAVEAVSEVAARDGFDRVLSLAGRDAGPWLLDVWWANLADTERRVHLPAVWCGAEYPVQALPKKRWLEMFATVGYCYDVDPESTDLPEWWQEGPSQPVELFRGAPVSSAGFGMSWTLDHEVAQFFADRWHDRGLKAEVYRTDVVPEAVLAFVHGRPEFEVVVDPSLLRDVHLRQPRWV